MRILSFDTSTQALHLCLWQDDKAIFAKSCYPEGANRQEVASLVIPEIDAAISQVGWRKGDLDLIVVGKGPGSFTGIRSAVVSARTIGQALELPVIGVCRLEAIAQAHIHQAKKGKCAVLLSASADSYFMAEYEKLSNEMVATIEPCWVNQDEVCNSLKNSSYVVAEDKACASLNSRGLVLQEISGDENVALAQAEIAAKRFKSLSAIGEKFHWGSVEPLYLRGPSVTLKKSYGDSNKTTNAC